MPRRCQRRPIMIGTLLYVVNEAGFFLSHRVPIALGARAAGLDVHVATPEGPGSERIGALGLTFHPYPLSRRGVRPFEEVGSVAALARLYRRLRPAIVHHVTIKPVLYGSVAARLTGVPAVVNAVTGLGYVFLAQGVRAQALRLGVRGAYRLAFGHPRVRVIFQNPDDRATFVEHGLVRADDTLLIKGSGVDMKRFAPAPEPAGDPIVVLASRMLWDKGIGEYVEAARHLRAERVRARFVLAGDSDPGNPAAIPDEQLHRWRDEGVVEWWGRRDDMPAVFAGCHVVCLPSYREGVPKVLIEAAAAGRPIVATDVPGCREIARHGENGLLVPVRESNGLAAALRRLIDDPAERARMGQRGRAIALAEFSEEQVVRETMSLYEELLA